MTPCVSALMSLTVHHGSARCRRAFDWNYRCVSVSYARGVLGVLIQSFSASWMATCLGGRPEWRRKVREEVRALVSEYSAETSSSRSLNEQLALIPLEAWEARTPVLEKVIREILRIAQPHTAMRRNMGPETYINGTRVPSGAYVVYPFSDVHLNPQLYPDPWRFDPDRAECTAQFQYVGWGGGKGSSSRFSVAIR